MARRKRKSGVSSQVLMVCLQNSWVPGMRAELLCCTAIIQGCPLGQSYTGGWKSGALKSEQKSGAPNIGERNSAFPRRTISIP